VTAYYAPRHITRATVGDEFFGPSCPKCANAKDDQALECRACYRDRVRGESYWQRRTCACGAPKYRHSECCNPCKYARQRTVGVLV
jgi:hypothetical protein